MRFFQEWLTRRLLRDLVIKDNAFYTIWKRHWLNPTTQRMSDEDLCWHVQNIIIERLRKQGDPESRYMAVVLETLYERILYHHRRTP